MDPKKPPTAPPADWKPGEKPDQPPLYQDQPPPYEDYNAGYNPPAEGCPNLPAYPPGFPHGALNVQPHENQLQPLFAEQHVFTAQPAVFVTTEIKREPDFLCFSIFTMLCCCLPLGIVALIYSVKTQDANLSGNNNQAEKHSRTACRLNCAAVAVGIIVLILNCLRLMY